MLLMSFQFGSEVLVDGTVTATISAIQIRGDAVMYECVWWNERARVLEWLESWEVRRDDDQSRTLRVNPIL